MSNIPINPGDAGEPSQPFVRKTVETPILDSDLRQKISGPSSSPNDSAYSEAGGFKSFYQSNKIYFWAILAGCLIIGVLAFFAFKKSPVAAPKGANVAINVSVPQTVAAGSEAVYTITVQNNDSQKLVNLQLELAYPDGATFDSSTPNPQDLGGTMFNVPDLIPGQNAVVFVKAKLAGNVGDQKTLDIKLQYQYSGISSEFVQDQTSAVTLSASDVTISLSGPTTTNNAQLVLYTINYQNNSGADIQNARVTMDYPDGFTFASATPPPDLGSNTWNVSTLANNASSTIQIQGTFNSANPGESKTATAEFLILGPDGNFFTQNSADFVTAISSLPLLVTQDLAPSSNTDVINPGDSLTFDVHYQNNASTVATGVNIEVDLNSKAVDFSSIQAQGGQVNNSSIIWNASGVPQLQSLSPSQGGDLTFSLKVNNPAVKDSSKNLTLVSNVQIKSNEYSTAFPGNTLTLKLSSPTAINTSLAYVSGQLPPEVGKPTVYQVTFSLTNSSNDFSNGVVTAFIPLASGGFDSSSITPAEANNVQFDPTADKLTWTMGSLPANTGRFGPPKILQFQVTLNPSSSQVGQAPTLVKTINFTANDLFTTQPVAASASDITTNDYQGTNGFSSGQVTP